MWISSLSITNFRCFDQLNLDFGKGLNILLGENSVGKSSVFVAISKLLQSTQQDPSQVFTTADLRYGKLEGRGLAVQCKLELDEQEQKQLLDRLLPQPLTLKKKGDVYKRLASALQVAEVTSTWEETSQNTYIRVGPVYILSKWVSNSVRSGGSVTPMNTLIHELLKNEDTLENILSRAELWESPQILFRAGALLLSYFKSFAEFRYRSSPVERSTTLESLSGSDTANVLLNLKNHPDIALRQRYDFICGEFCRFFPSINVEAVESELGGRIADVQFIEKGKDWPIPLNNVGAGVIELLTFLTNLVARKGFIFVIEEPELHLHPQAKRQLYKLIKESSTRNQVFVVTHDPYFIDPDNLHCLTRFSITGQGTRVASLPSTLSSRVRGQLKTAMKDTAKRELLFARAVLLVEDESQQKFILECANKLPYNLDSSGLSVIDVGGKDGFEPYIKLVDAFGVPYLCLADLPWGPSLNRPPSIFRSLGYELEEYLDQHGFGPLMKQAKQKVGDNKPRVARYVGEHIIGEQIPPFFSELIADAVKLCENQ